MKILIAEDEPALRHAPETLLQRNNYCAESVSNGTDALDYLRIGSYDAEQIMTLLAWDITEKQQNGLGNTNPQVYRTVFITEYVARDLAKKYASKDALEYPLFPPRFLWTKMVIRSGRPISVPRKKPSGRKLLKFC